MVEKLYVKIIRKLPYQILIKNKFYLLNLIFLNLSDF